MFVPTFVDLQGKIDDFVQGIQRTQVVDKFVFDAICKTLIEEMNESTFTKVLNAILISVKSGNVTCYRLVFFHSKLVEFSLVIFPFIGISKDVKDGLFEFQPGVKNKKLVVFFDVIEVR